MNCKWSVNGSVSVFHRRIVQYGMKVEERKDATRLSWNSCKSWCLLDSKTSQLESLKSILKGEADCSCSTRVFLHCSARRWCQGSSQRCQRRCVCAILGVRLLAKFKLLWQHGQIVMHCRNDCCTFETCVEDFKRIRKPHFELKHVTVSARAQTKMNASAERRCFEGMAADRAEVEKHHNLMIDFMNEG